MDPDFMTRGLGERRTGDGGNDFEDDAEVICPLCRQTLIHPVEAECGHTFCDYCLMIWHKHHARCPICDKGISRVDSDEVVQQRLEDYFGGANFEKKIDRSKTVDTRFGDEKTYYQRLCKETDSNSNIEERDHVTMSAREKKQYSQLLQETDELSANFEDVYSKVTSIGTKLNKKEEMLMNSKYGVGMFQMDSHTRNAPGSRPCTAPANARFNKPPKNSARAGCKGKSARKSRKISELDELASLAEEDLGIEDLLEDLTFERMIRKDSVSKSVNDFERKCQEFPPPVISDCEDGYDTDFDASTFKVHPEVEDYLAKNCSTKIAPVRPRTNNKLDPTDASLRVPRDMFASRIVKEIAAVEAMYGADDEEDQPSAASEIRKAPRDPAMYTELEKYRDSLISMRNELESEMQWEQDSKAPANAKFPKPAPLHNLPTSVASARTSGNTRFGSRQLFRQNTSVEEPKLPKYGNLKPGTSQMNKEKSFDSFNPWNTNAERKMSAASGKPAFPQMTKAQSNEILYEWLTNNEPRFTSSNGTYRPAPPKETKDKTLGMSECQRRACSFSPGIFADRNAEYHRVLRNIESFSKCQEGGKLPNVDYPRVGKPKNDAEKFLAGDTTAIHRLLNSPLHSKSKPKKECVKPSEPSFPPTGHFLPYLVPPPGPKLSKFEIARAELLAEQQALIAGATTKGHADGVRRIKKRVSRPSTVCTMEIGAMKPGRYNGN